MSHSVLSTPNQRMLALIDMLLASGEIPNRQTFLDVIKMPKQTYRKIAVLGTQSFTVAHIARACAYYNIDANWVLGITDTTRPLGQSQQGSAKKVRQAESQTKPLSTTKKKAAGAS